MENLSQHLSQVYPWGTDSGSAVGAGGATFDGDGTGLNVTAAVSALRWKTRSCC